LFFKNGMKIFDASITATCPSLKVKPNSHSDALPVLYASTVLPSCRMDEASGKTFPTRLPGVVILKLSVEKVVAI
jgi:hypothetical protein